MESDATGRPLVDYIWMDNRPVLQTVYDRNTAEEVTQTYLLTDHLGAPRVGLNDQRQIVWRWDDGGFGEEKAEEDPDGDGHKVTINLRFPGQYYDKESGLHYNWHRYYDPTTGRYITSDPMGLTGGINTYAYVENNPINSMDSLGLWSISIQGYLGWGGGITFGGNPNGSSFIEIRGGYGIGGGVGYNPNGTSTNYDSCRDYAVENYWGVGVSAWAGVEVGPVELSVNAQAGVNSNSYGDTSGYADVGASASITDNGFNISTGANVSITASYVTGVPTITMAGQ